MAIPHIIHTIWYQGIKAIPPKYNYNINSVIKYNPEYQYILWDNNSIQDALKTLGNHYLSRYNSLKLLHQKIDYARYALLYLHGGISVDMDAEALKGFDNTPHINDSDFIVSKNSTNAFINNATILVSKENPLIKELLDNIDTDCKFYQGDTSCVMYSTGPRAFDKFVNKNLDKITVLDNIYFEPCSGRDNNCKLSSDTILNHKHEGSWVNPVYNKMREAYYAMKPYGGILMLVIFLIILYILFRTS